VRDVDPAARTVVRALTTCAVLLGLAFMHSLGLAIGNGCHGGTSSATPSSALHAAAGGHNAAMVEVTASAYSPEFLATMPSGAGHGTLCVSTPPPDDVTVPSAPTATAAAAPAALGQPSPRLPRVAGVDSRAGPALLISLCVSRT
jgi:hypothetical protein